MKKLRFRAREVKPSVRRYKRGLIRQIASFYNLSRNPEFLRDIKSVRRDFGMELPRRDGKPPPYAGLGGWRAKKALFKKLKEECGDMPIFNILRGSYDVYHLYGHMLYRVKHSFWGRLQKLTDKWHIRKDDAFAIVYGNDYPPYPGYFKGQERLTLYQLILRETEEMQPPSENFIEKVRKLRKNPEPKRFWWIDRFQNKSLSTLIRPYLNKKVSARKICDELLENSCVDKDGNPYTYEAVRKATYRTNKKMGQ